MRGNIGTNHRLAWALAALAWAGPWAGGAAGAVPIDGDGDGSPLPFDCDDGDPNVLPGHVEVCNGVDDDCDQLVDDQDPGVVGAMVLHPDCDGDGQGDAAVEVIACAPPLPPTCGGVWLDDASDCDDTDVYAYVGAPELCAAGDQDCDGDTDLGAIDAAVYYIDADRDGYGTTEVVSCAADVPDGLAVAPGDCDDTDDRIHPDAIDPCGDGVDRDCDGNDGDDETAPLWYPDTDGDGYGDPLAEPVRSCEDLTYDGYASAALALDCDDTDEHVSPLVFDGCNGVDDDCDGLVDNGPLEKTWYPDADADAYGDDAAGVERACAPDPSWIATPGDCDDANPAVNPDAPERCNHYDDDCDGATDSAGGAIDTIEVWHDADGDGYGWCDEPGCAGERVCTFERAANDADNGDDCDDGDPRINPSRAEIAGNDVDEDCDGEVTAGEPPPEGGGCGCGISEPARGWATLALALIAGLGSTLSARRAAARPGRAG